MSTSNGREPREFWINNQQAGSYVYHYEPKFKTEGEIVHVIEYSAYEALLAQLREAKIYVRKWADTDTQLSIAVKALEEIGADLSAQMTDAPLSRSQPIEFARQTLRQIYQLKENLK